MREFLHAHPVYISLTTSPARIEYLPEVLENLDLSEVSMILLNIPFTYGRTSETYTIPAAIRHHPKIMIQRLPEDLGPISKIIPGIQYAQARDPEALVIAIDDDVAYPRGMVAEHIYTLVHHPRTVTAANWRRLDQRWHISRDALARWPNEQYAVVQGFASIGYQAKDFPWQSMLRWLELEKRSGGKDCYLSDDLVISYGLAKKGLRVKKISSPYLSNTAVKMFSFSYNAGAISQTERKKKHINPNDTRLHACFKTLTQNQE